MKVVFFTSIEKFIEEAASRIPMIETVGVVSAENFVESTRKKLDGKNIEFFLAKNLKDKNFLEKMRLLKPDLFVVFYFGKILPKELLTIPLNGALNIHFSLLPKLRLLFQIN